MSVSINIHSNNLYKNVKSTTHITQITIYKDPRINTIIKHTVNIF
jgi:hypothetical protein